MFEEVEKEVKCILRPAVFKSGKQKFLRTPHDFLSFYFQTWAHKSVRYELIYKIHKHSLKILFRGVVVQSSN